MDNHPRSGPFPAQYLAHALLFVLMASVLARMLAHPYSFCDDLTHYFSLHQYVNGGVPVKTPGGELQAAHAVVLGIRLIFVALAGLFQALGVAYPFLAASKFWAFCMLPISYAVWAVYLKKPLGQVLGSWAALAIVLLNTINHIIPSGLARSSNVLLLGLWCMALRKRSPAAISGVLLLTSIVYPVILPVLGISLFFATAWAWRDKETTWFRAGVLILGFVTSTAYMVIKSLTSFAAFNLHPMSYSEMLSVLVRGDFSPNLDIPKLIGRLGNQSLVEWFQFNVFNYWTSTGFQFEITIIVCILGLCATGLVFARMPRHAVQPWMLWITVLFLAIGSIASFRERYFFLAVCWFCALASLGWVVLPKYTRKSPIPMELKILIPSSVAAFLIVHMASYKIFVMVLDPGRQLQKTFAILAPVLTVLYVARLFSLGEFKHRRQLGAILGSCAVLYGCWALDLGYHSYTDEKVMRAIRDLPPGAEVLCHPQTADFVLIMTGKGTSTARELVRIGAKPYTSDIIAAYARDVDLLYSNGPEKLRQWCGQNPKNKYILGEPDMYTPEETGRLFDPYNQAMEQRRQSKYYLDKLESPCKIKIGETASLISCECLLNELKEQTSDSPQPEEKP
ncbi:MAG: hypothetical protein JEZ02_12740 [Desulfatibacillum sp.]|nr:hypothetical protein [Desulfatibacillum sp.]